VDFVDRVDGSDSIASTSSTDRLKRFLIQVQFGQGGDDVFVELGEVYFPFAEGRFRRTGGAGVSEKKPLELTRGSSV